jgi:hypothetical protein
VTPRVSTRFTHGASGYDNYCCRCATCRAGHAAKVREQRTERFALRVRVGDRLVAPLPASRHGSQYTYSNWGCRCERCTAANRARQRSLAARRRAEMNVKTPPLSESLGDWTDWDVASYELGCCLGLFESQSFQVDVKHVFWTENPLGRSLLEALKIFVDAEILEARDENPHDGNDLQFRWRVTP